MALIIDNFFITSPIANEDDIWSTEAIYIKDNSSLAKPTWPYLPLCPAPPPGLPVPAYLFAASGPGCVEAVLTGAKPKELQPQLIQPVIKILGLRPSSSSTSTDDELDEPIIRSFGPPRKTGGIYGDRPRLPSHRPSRYISEYPCDGDRFAHLKPLRGCQAPIVTQDSPVHLETMGLERLDMSQPEPEFMDVEEEAEPIQIVNLVVRSSPLPPSDPVQSGFGTGGLRGALSNFRARFGAMPGASTEVEKEEGGIGKLPEGGHVDVMHDGWMAP